MTTYPCPLCGSVADLASGCPGCGRAPDPVAAEVIRLDGEITGLVQTLRTRQQRRNELAAQVSAAVRAERAAARRPPVAAAGVAPTPPAGPPPVAGPETSVRTVQNVLFILGGLLLGTAAIVFTAVAWATFGVGGRAAILAVVTGLALGVPALALRRGLTATAETFAAVGLLLVLLDGYAAWYVNLFGVAEISVRRYAVLVCAVTAVVAAGYGAATHLVGPRFVALVVAQPVLPLLAADTAFGPAGWAGVSVSLAALNLAVAGWRGGGPALRAFAWALYGIALGAAAVTALGALTFVDTVPATARVGVALVAVGLVLVAGSLVARAAVFRVTAAAVLVVLVAAAATRFAAVAWPASTLVLAAAVAAGTAGAVRLLPAPVRPGPRAGALVVVGLLALTVLVLTLVGWVAWQVERDVVSDRQLPAAVLLATAALAVLVRRADRHDIAVAGGVVLVMGLPVAIPLAWPALALANLAALAAAAVGAALAGSSRPAVVRAAAAAALLGHAVLVSLSSAGASGTVLGAVAGIGAAVAVIARRRSTVYFGAVALGVAMVAVPLAVQRGLTAGEVDRVWAARSALGATAGLVLALAVTARWWPGYRRAGYLALAAAVLLTGWPPPAEPRGVYAAVGLLLVLAGGALGRSRDWWAPAVPVVVLGISLGADVGPSLWAVLGAPYEWLGAVWSGPPAGPGLSPSGLWVARAPDALALAVAAVAAGIGVGWWRHEWRVVPVGGLPVACPALLVGLAAAGAPWPAVPAAGLLLGLAAGLAAALAPRGRRLAPVAVPLAVVLTGAGLAGALPTERATLAALGLTLVASAAAGTGGRAVGARVAGWLASAASAVLTAVAAGLAADLPLRAAAFGVLGAAALTLAVGAALRPRRPVDAVALEAAGHAAAFVALLLTAGSARYAAGVATLWGIAVGLRALWPGERVVGRRVRAAVAVGCELLAWWLLLVAAQVALVEAYTLPVAAVALFAGWLALRARPVLGSWVAYGPALAAASLPSLASILVTEGVPARRLLLGVGGLAAVVAGAVWRRQAPVVVGGLVLVVLSLHELVLVWDLLQRWIPLAVAGLLLVWLAMTYERRRRDMARLRDTLGRMT